MRLHHNLSRLLFGLILVLQFFPVKAQISGKQYGYIEPSLRWGHHIPFAQYADYPAYCADIRLGIQTTGEKPWERFFNYPMVGIDLRYEHNTMKNYLHPDAGLMDLGDALSLFGYCNGHLINKKRFQFDYTWGIGLSYWTTHGNPLIGSAMTVHLTVDCGPVFRLSESWDVFARASFSHASNGAVVLPNKGINVLCGQIGCRYHLNGRAPITASDMDTVFQKGNTIYIYEASGFRESNTILDRYCFGNTFEIGYTRSFHPCFRYGAAIDLLFSGENKIMYEYNGELDQYHLKNSFSMAPVATFDIVYGRFMLHIAGAYYIVQPTKYVPKHYLRHYERLGFRYVLDNDKRFFTGVSMKIHSTKIDYIEWTIGANLFNW